MHNFRKLDIWIKSVNFVTEIYRVTESLPSKEKYGLISQLERASVSIPTNIAEGSAKTSNKDFARFLEMSIGSAYEVETELLVSYNLEYINKDSYEKLQNELVILEKMLTAFKNQLNQTIEHRQ